PARQHARLAAGRGLRAGARRGGALGRVLRPAGDRAPRPRGARHRAARRTAAHHAPGALSQRVVMVARALGWRVVLAVAALAVTWRIVVVNGVLYDMNGRPHLPQPAATPGIEETPGKQALAAALARNPAE